MNLYSSFNKKLTDLINPIALNNNSLRRVDNSTTTPYAPRFMRGVQKSQDISGSRGQARGLCPQGRSRDFSVNCQQPLELIVALSGGLDSIVLLDLLHKYINSSNNNYKINIKAVYIDHNLQPASKQWSKFNHTICDGYKIDYSSYSIEYNQSDKDNLIKQHGLEGYARLARYNIFKNLIDNKYKVLLTAHHLNDQAETFLLQLMRGAGPKGLSSMPESKKFSEGYHIRPLLDLQREQILNYATSNNLSWIEDLTNDDISYDRNFIRHNIINTLEQRWPHALASIARSANMCSNNENLLYQYVHQDYINCIVKPQSISKYINNYFLVSDNLIDIAKLGLYNHDKKIAILRHWLQQAGIKAPGARIVYKLITDVINAKIDSKAEFIIDQVVISKYKNKLFLLDKQAVQANFNIDTSYNYKINSQLDLNINEKYKLIVDSCEDSQDLRKSDAPRLDRGVHRLLDPAVKPRDVGFQCFSKIFCVSPDSDGDRRNSDYLINKQLVNISLISDKQSNNYSIIINQNELNNLSIRFGDYAQICKPVWRHKSTSLKKILQECHIPPWQRDKIPLLCIGNQIAVILGVTVCFGFDAAVYCNSDKASSSG